MRAARIFETSLYSQDLDAAERFYCEVMGLDVVSRFGERGMAFRCGAGVLLVFDPARTADGDIQVPAHGAAGPGHVAFVMEPETIEDWRRHLEHHGVEIETEVEWSEGLRSLYFRDPAGNCLELAPPTLWGFDPGSPA